MLSRKLLKWFFWLWCCYGFGLFMYAFVWVGFAGIANASSEETKRLLEDLSIPLGLVSGNFVLRPNTGAWKSLAISFANGYFFALAVLPCIRFAQWRMAENRAIQLGITRPTAHFDTYETEMDESENKPEGE